MNSVIRQEQNKVIITMPAKFDVSEAADFREQLLKFLAAKQTDYLLDFSNCQFIDSTGLGVLVSIHKRCMEDGRSLKIYAAKDNVLKVFRLTRLDQVFEIVDSW